MHHTMHCESAVTILQALFVLAGPPSTDFTGTDRCLPTRSLCHLGDYVYAMIWLSCLWDPQNAYDMVVVGYLAVPVVVCMPGAVGLVFLRLIVCFCHSIPMLSQQPQHRTPLLVSCARHSVIMCCLGPRVICAGPRPVSCTCRAVSPADTVVILCSECRSDDYS